MNRYTTFRFNLYYEEYYGLIFVCKTDEGSVILNKKFQNS